MTLKLSFKPKNQLLLGLVIIATATTGVITYYSISQSGLVAAKPSPDAEVVPAPQKVTALGRLEPQGEVIKLSAPLALDGDRVAKLLVQEGDTVKAGQVIAIMDSRARLQDSLLQAQKQVMVAKAKLAQVKAGAKSGEIAEKQVAVERLQAQLQGDILTQKEAIARLEAQWLGEKMAQEATIRKLAAELNNATAEYQRYQRLYLQGAISSSLFDGKRLSLETAKQQIQEAQAVLNRINTTSSKQIRETEANFNRVTSTGSKQVGEAKATLSSVAEVRPVDVQAAQMEVESAMAGVTRAKTDLEQVYIRTAIAGQVIKIHTKVGEKISDSGIADLGQTQQMMAVAEVYQTDIGKIKIGQAAVITSQGFNGELRGKVSQIGLQVKRQNVFSNQPGENLDSRVVEVKIRLTPEDSKRVAGLTNLQVQTAIEL
jgi:HlyD family secretion protein